MRRVVLLGVTLWASALACGCRCESQPDEKLAAGGSAALPPPSARPLQRLYLPDAGEPLETLPAVPRPAPAGSGRCPAEMVDVQGAFCIDRYEASLVDAVSGQRLSPYYHPTRGQALKSFEFWQNESKQVGPGWARRMPLPDLPAWQREREPQPKAVSEAGQVPSGYLSGELAQAVCERAGKRLCNEGEWVTACKGQAQQKFPYGPEYRHGVCNVLRDSHPAALLHSDASEGHLDPRLNQVKEGAASLLQITGNSPECASRWGSDAIYDMVGNLDEWVDDPSGKFLGGFYSRGTKDGCEASVSAHPRSYFDYSLGVRCCR